MSLYYLYKFYFYKSKKILKKKTIELFFLIKKFSSFKRDVTDFFSVFLKKFFTNNFLQTIFLFNKNYDINMLF